MIMTENNYLKIKDLSEQDRPREKLLSLGARALSDSELIAIIIGSGTPNQSAVDLARAILGRYNGNLNDLGRTTFSELKTFKGIGDAKAVNILAMLELGRRRASSSSSIKETISNSLDSYRSFYQRLSDLDHEEMWIMLLNKSNNVIAIESLSKGGMSRTIVDARIVMKRAIETSAAGFIIAHNHPSGNLRPSGPDDTITQQLYDAGKLLQIPLRDHLIIGTGGIETNSYYSYNDNCRIIK